MDFDALMDTVKSALDEFRTDIRTHLVLAIRLFDNYWIERDSNGKIHIVHMMGDDINKTTNLFQIQEEEISYLEILDFLKELLVDSIITS